MKEVMAFIRPEKLGATRTAMLEAGAEEVVQRRVLGRGKQRGLRYLSPSMDGGRGEMLYLSKRMVVCWVPDEVAQAVVEAVIAVNQTGNVGDGKIFVRPLATVEAEAPAVAAVVAAGA